MPISALSPSIVWKHFATLAATPRLSKQEAGLRTQLAAWAHARGLDYETDPAGNLLIRKAASPGHENAPTLALQGHLDMVWQTKSGAASNSLQIPAMTLGEDGWLQAENSTLGADNGIGVALALAALEDDTLCHGPLEVLLTVDEEAGMGGAHGLAPGWLKASRMLNLDTEEWGEFYLGCAGGCDVNVSADLATRPPPADHGSWSLVVGGLRGGHSGCDIHLRRGNANRLLAEALRAIDLALDGNLGLSALSGGTARNALPREAVATISFAAGALPLAANCIEALQTRWRATLGGDRVEKNKAGKKGEADNPAETGHLEPSDDAGDPAVTLTLSPAKTVSSVLDPMVARRLIDALCRTPYGVDAMSPDFAGVVETSNNLGVLSLADGHFAANLMVRSLVDPKTVALAGRIAEVFSSAGLTISIEGHYPGWTPDPASPLLALCQRVYRQTFGSDSKVQVIHAGLECGIIGAKYPGLDTVSFGPTIRGAHAPGERVDIASVGRCWTLLRAVIGELSHCA